MPDATRPGASPYAEAPPKLHPALDGNEMGSLGEEILHQRMVERLRKHGIFTTDQLAQDFFQETRMFLISFHGFLGTKKHKKLGH